LKAHGFEAIPERCDGRTGELVGGLFGLEDATRDLLLPRLSSGKLAVEELEIAYGLENRLPACEGRQRVPPVRQ
jgi:hypothetical protein